MQFSLRHAFGGVTVAAIYATSLRSSLVFGGISVAASLFAGACFYAATQISWAPPGDPVRPGFLVICQEFLATVLMMLGLAGLVLAAITFVLSFAHH